MLVNINEIKVDDRIRKDFGNIEELAEDIKENGLINPPTVTPELELIAGERRLRACKHLGYAQIEVRVMTVKDEEHQLKLEISENENRKEFSYSERMDWAKRLERIERIKAEKRMKTGEEIDPVENFPQGKTRDLVGEKSGFGSGKQYEKAKFIHENADEEVIKQLNEEKISIHRAWTETKEKLKEAEDKLREKNTELLRAKTPKVEIKEVVKEVIPEEVTRKYEQAQQEKRQLEHSLMRTYERIEELEKIEKSVKTQEESPLYDIIRSLQTVNRNVDSFTISPRRAESVVDSASDDVVGKLETEIRRAISKMEGLLGSIDKRNGVVVVDAENTNNTMGVINHD